MIKKLAFLGLGFVLGVFVAGTLTSSAAREEKTKVQESASAREKAKEQELTDAKEQARELALERDTCLAKFERYTILYDGMLSSRKWMIPADVEPATFGDRDTAAYSHYDPKTQAETGKLKPKHR